MDVADTLEKQKLDTLKRCAILFSILFVFLLVIEILLNVGIRQRDVSYREVEATITDISTKRVGWGYRKQNRDVITVEVNGQTYELDNVQTGEEARYETAYAFGESVTVYESDGKMYSNLAGIRTDTPIMKVYFVLLFVTFAVFTAALTFIKMYRDARKKCRSIE